MNNPTVQNVHLFIADFVSQKVKERGKGSLTCLPDDYDLLESGVLDSLAFIEMLVAVGNHFAGQIDLESLEPEKMTVIGPLCTFISEQLLGRPYLCDPDEVSAGLDHLRRNQLNY